MLTDRSRASVFAAGAACLVFGLPLSPSASRAADERPNVVVIVTDNHGAWTLGCYGNREIRTPNIDRLAAEGMRFTRAYCTNSVCSPSRASLMTGLIPSQHGIHCYLPEPIQDEKPYGGECRIREFQTLPRIRATSAAWSASGTSAIICGPRKGSPPGSPSPAATRIRFTTPR
jgi:hypothetical protein